MASDLTPIETMVKAWLEGQGMWAEQLSSRINVGRIRPSGHVPTILELFTSFAAHVEAQRSEPGKVLTDEEVEALAQGRIMATSSGQIACIDGWQESDVHGFADGLRYARDNGYIAPSKPMPTVDQVMEVVGSFIDEEAEMEDGARWNWEAKHPQYKKMIADLRERLNKLMP